MNLEYAKEVFLEVYEILKKSQIELFLSDGTALGAIRDGGFISWDHDIDLRVAATNWDFSIFEEFKRHGFRCIKSINLKAYRGLPSGSVIFKQGIRMDIGLNYYYPPEDIVAFLAGRPSLPGSLQPARFYRGDHFVDFLGIKARIQYPPEEYAERIYGATWRIPLNDGSRAVRKPISMKKYVDYFLEHPEVNERK